MKRIFFAICLSAFYVSTSTALAANKVVVIPLGGGKISPNQSCLGKSVVIGIDADGKLICNSKTVFVSSQTYSGALGGLSGADEKCNNLASTAGLTGDYKAWLSTGTTDPIRRFNQDAGSYILTDGTVIAHNFSDLTDGYLRNTIDLTEKSAHILNPMTVWTNTLTDGRRYSVSTHCQDWTSSMALEWGWIGTAERHDYKWTNDGLTDCQTQRRIYCFEQ